MTERRNNDLPFLLALTAWVTLATYFALFILALLQSGFPFGEDVFIPFEKMWSFAGCLFLTGWLPGLALAVISLFTLRLSRTLFVKILVWILSPLAIIAAFLWAFVALIWLIQTLFGHS